jgi:hypothetical protein
MTSLTVPIFRQIESVTTTAEYFAQQSLGNRHLRGRLDSDRRLPSTVVGLGSNNLVVVVTEGHAGVLPCLENDTHIDGTALALLGADGPVLLEGLGAVDGGLLVAGALVQLVGRAGMLDGAARLGLAARVVLAAEIMVLVTGLKVFSQASWGCGLLTGTQLRSTRPGGCESSRKCKGTMSC